MSGHEEVSSPEFCIWNEERHLNGIYYGLGSSIRPELFSIHSEFIMDSAFARRRREESAGNFPGKKELVINNGRVRSVEKKRKRLENARECEGEAADGCGSSAFLFNKIKAIASVARVAALVKQTGLAASCFKTLEKVPDNNLSARKAAREAEERVIEMPRDTAASESEVSMTELLPSPEVLSLMCPWFRAGGDLVFDYPRPSTSSADHEVRKKRLGKKRKNSEGSCETDLSPSERYLVPSGAVFHIADVRDICSYAAINERQFDIILMDPPWTNKSVRRAEAYSMEEALLLELPIDDLLSPGGIVAVWRVDWFIIEMTHAGHVHSFLTECFLRWKLKLAGVWHWLKVTTQGVPVCSFQPGLVSAKQPFESLLLLCREDDVIHSEKIMETNSFVVASIPMCVHSRKPSVLPLLQKHLGVGSNSLELFARSLQPGVTSVGFEPLLLQSEAYFKRIND